MLQIESGCVWGEVFDAVLDTVSNRANLPSAGLGTNTHEDTHKESKSHF